MTSEKQKKILEQIKGARIDENGYIIVPSRIASVGIQQFAGTELGKELVGDSGLNNIFDVEVTEKELFSADTIKSFEGKPLTLTHPNGNDVNSQTWKDLAVGHVQNIRRDGIYLVGDVYITDDLATDVIIDNKIKELSIGYECIFEKQKLADGKILFEKRDIKGNHLAVVGAGRCGKDVKLGDGKMNFKELLEQALKAYDESEEKQGSLDFALSLLAILEGAEDEGIKAIASKIKDLVNKAKDELEQAKAQGDKKGDSDETLTPDNPAPEISTGSTLPEDVAGLKGIIAQKDAEITELKGKVETLEKELAQLKESKELEKVTADAKTVFGDSAGKGKTATAFKKSILVANGIYKQGDSVSDAEIASAYATLRAQKMMAKPKVRIQHGDSKKITISKDVSNLFGKK